MLENNLMIENIPAFITVLPMLAAAAIPFVTNSYFAWLTSLLICFVGLLNSFFLYQKIKVIKNYSYPFGNWEPPWGIEFVIDGANIGLLILINFISLVVTFYSRFSLLSEIITKDIPKVYSAWLLCIGSLNGLVMTADAFNLFVFLEISALSSITLIALGAGFDRRALLASYNYLIIGALGATLYVIGVGYLYAVTGTLNMADLAIKFQTLENNNIAILTGVSFMIAGIMVKAAIFPAHIWLPAAYSFAPSAVSSLLAAISTKVSLYILIRLCFGVFGDLQDFVFLFLNWILIPLSIIAMFYGTITAIYEKDFKKLLAQSSIAQIGYITLAFSLKSIPGITAAFVHIFNHALIKGGLFLAVGIFSISLQARVNMKNAIGLGKKMPITFVGFLVCGLGLIGLPLTSGFISKILLVKAMLNSEEYFIIFLIVFSSALSVIYLWKIVEVMWLQESKSSVVEINESSHMFIPVWIIASLIIYFGINPDFIVNMSHFASITLLGVN